MARRFNAEAESRRVANLPQGLSHAENIVSGDRISKIDPKVTLQTLRRLGYSQRIINLAMGRKEAAAAAKASRGTQAAATRRSPRTTRQRADVPNPAERGLYTPLPGGNRMFPVGNPTNTRVSATVPPEPPKEPPTVMLGV